MSTDELSKMKEILKNDLPNRHSFFQLKYFVIGKEPTAQGKMWQIMRELRVRSAALDGLKLEIEDTKDNIELIEIELERNTEPGKFDIDSSSNPLDMKEREIQKRKLNRNLSAARKKLEELEVKIKNTTEEAVFFVKSFEAIQKVEKLKPYDDLEAQTEYWSEKIAKEVNLRGILNAPISMELIYTALSLPDEAPIKKETIYMIENAKKAITSKQLQQQ